MKFYTKECVNCGLPCKYETCPYYKVEHFRCDECYDEDIKLYNYYGRELCAECVLKNYEVVEGSELL